MLEDAELGYSPLPPPPTNMQHKWHKLRGKERLDMSNEEDKRALQESIHYCRYALAIYTWYLYVFDRSELKFAVVNVGGERLMRDV